MSLEKNRTEEIEVNNWKNLVHNIPGGVHQCKNDAHFTLVSMNDGFLSMVGYTHKELGELFDYHYIEMVYKGDRKEVVRIAGEQLQKGNEIELEYRVVRKDGTAVWVIDKGKLVEDECGERSFYCVIMEITDRKQGQEELRLSLERHQVIMDQTTDIIFEWDIRKDTLSFSPNWYKKFGYDAIDTQISDRIPHSKDIHPDDMESFMEIMKDTAKGVPYSTTEFRIRNQYEQYCWCRIRATTQYDSDGRPIKAVGVILDIDDEIKQKQVLFEMAQKDALTGLYNKATINTLVERRMRREEMVGFQSIFIIDVDYFKGVNDTYGHLIGDSLLSDVAAALKENVRATDLVGRIGGDEFLVYLYDVADEAAAESKAHKLADALGTIRPKKDAPTISCSIGGVVFSHGETDFQTLYKKADKALYHRKNNGRNGVTIYDPRLCGEANAQNVQHTAVGEAIVSNQDMVMDEHLPQYAFRTLYGAREVKPTIDRLLEIVGRAYDVSRAYVFESSEDGTCCSNTFEWCNVGVEPQMEVLQDLSYEEDLGGYQGNFDESGLFYCADIRKTHPGLRSVLEPQGIRSMLQCAMLDEGEFVGYVGFDECRENREWTPQQVVTFKLTADVLSIFLIKYRQKQRLNKEESK